MPLFLSTRRAVLALAASASALSALPALAADPALLNVSY
ncbi:MAG: sulfate ABC transporter substrate-binding protein, partial [Rubrivivax sp.]